MSKLPPHNSDAERGILSACIASAGDHAEVRDMLTTEDFYLDAHQTIFRTLCAMRDNAKPVDYVTLAEELKASGQIENVGGVAYVAEMIGFGNNAHLEHYVRIVLDAKISRDVSTACNEASKKASENSAPIAEVLECVQRKLSTSAAKMLGDTDAADVASAVNSLLDMIDRRSKGERQRVTPTGFAELDNLLNGGLRPGHLAILAARPSVGKTALAVNITRNVCELGEAVLFVSLEQSREELTGRLMASVSGVTGTGIMRGRLDSYDHKRISDAADVVRGWRLDIRDRAGMNASQIAATARLAKRRYNGLSLLVVDYLNETRPDEASDKRTNRNEQLGAICRRLRECAKTLGVPCLLLAQLNRDVAKENQIPSLHHLRDSGEIEQIADVVMLLHREDLPEGRPEQLRLFVAKQRNGALGSSRFEHDAPRFRFTEIGK